MISIGLLINVDLLFTIEICVQSWTLGVLPWSLLSTSTSGGSDTMKQHYIKITEQSFFKFIIFISLTALRKLRLTEDWPDYISA